MTGRSANRFAQARKNRVGASVRNRVCHCEYFSRQEIASDDSVVETKIGIGNVRVIGRRGVNAFASRAEFVAEISHCAAAKRNVAVIGVAIAPHELAQVVQRFMAHFFAGARRFDGDPAVLDPPG